MTADLEQRLRDAAGDASRVAATIDTWELRRRIEGGSRFRHRFAPALATLAVLAVVAVAAVAIGQLRAPSPRNPFIGDGPDRTVPADPLTRPSPTPDISQTDPGVGTDGDCSAAGLTPVPPPRPDLPAEVAALRDHLASLAVACDYEGLAALTDEQFSHSFGDSDDPADSWRRAEGAAGQDDPGPMRSLRRILEAPAGVVDYVSAGPARYWAWPRLHLLDPAQTPRDELERAIDEVVATGLYTRAELGRMLSEAGGYLGYRLVIEVPEGATDARWAVFTAGD